jgi:hypothetical protein
MALPSRVKIIILFTALWPAISFSQVMRKSSCAIPLDEKRSAPSIDLLNKEGKPIDRDTLIDMIKAGQDTSFLEPQLSDLYTAREMSLNETHPELPSDEEVISKPLQFVSSIEVDHLTQARVVFPHDQTQAYKLTVTYDVNAALARNALLRKLGYASPSPKLYRKLLLEFPDLDTRNDFLTRISRMRDIGRWVDGGREEVERNQTTITLINVALEPAVILNIPPMHWGIFNSDILQSRRSLRALLVPLTLLDIDESVNMYPYEPAKVENNRLVFSRVYAKAFTNETSIGDARWIARKIAKLSRQDWIKIIRAGHYPADIESLIIEKTLGRVNQLMKLLTISDFLPIAFDPNISYGQIIRGKAYQSEYEGYPQFFAYSDPLNPLRVSEIIRYFSVEAISNAMQFVLDQGNRFLQFLSQEKYVKAHSEKFQNQILQHMQTHPDQPYVQPIETWGGPVAGASVSANRSVIAGTYYGNTSPIQLVDTISVNAKVGYFLGISGIKNIGIGITPSLGYSRNYAHVRPIGDIKTALKDNWAKVAVPFEMIKLSNVLNAKDDDGLGKAIENFLSELKQGEMFIITDGFTLAQNTLVGIPIGAMLGLAPPVVNLSESININHQYAVLSRTTIYRSEKGLQIYFSDIRTKGQQLSADTDLLFRIFSASGYRVSGEAHTDAYVLPAEFNSIEEKKNFISGMKTLLRMNQGQIIQERFKPFLLDHESRGGRSFIKIGPWQWTRREILNRLEITPPVDPEGRYDANQFKRTVIQGQINRIRGSDFFGFIGSIANRFVSLIKLGSGARGDDPSTNFMGRSTSNIVSTELEITPNRPNNTLIRIQQSHNGWSMKKKNLLKLLNSIQSELGAMNPPGDLFDAETFSQTKRVQAYNLIWNLSIYESGIDRITEYLDQKNWGTVAIAEKLISIMGAKNYENYCSKKGLEVGFSRGPVRIDDFLNSSSETIQGQTISIHCVTPWMQTIFDLRDKFSKTPELFAHDIHDEASAKIKIEALNQALVKLEKNTELGTIIRLVGAENSYFQVSLAGYRKGDERAQDEEGRSTYFSNSVGQVNATIRNGPLDEIASSSTILQHEISARYLSDGY